MIHTGVVFVVVMIHTGVVFMVVMIHTGVVFMVVMIWCGPNESRRIRRDYIVLLYPHLLAALDRWKNERNV